MRKKSAIIRIRTMIKKIILSLFLALKYIRHLQTAHYLSIVAIIKNDGNYIAEWIEYHLLVGVTKFYIYYNESNDNIKDILEPYIKTGIVEYKYFPGKMQQLHAYMDALKKVRKETYWLAVIDIDEFIVPISTITVSDFLKDFEKFPRVEINWIMYGSSGKKNKENGLVMERFKDHSSIEFNSNRCVKIIINPRFTTKIFIHNAECIFWKNNVNANKEKAVPDFLYRNGVFDKIVVNHYFTKSYEEWILRRNRDPIQNDGRPPRKIEEFHFHDRNEVKNDTIMDKYIPIIHKNLKLRYGNIQ